MLDPLFRRDPQVVGHPDVEGPPLTDEMVAAAERRLGVTLPPAYLELMRTCNGGYTAGAVLPTSEPTSWAPDHVPVDVVFGVPALGEEGPHAGAHATPWCGSWTASANTTSAGR